MPLTGSLMTDNDRDLPGLTPGDDARSHVASSETRTRLESLGIPEAEDQQRLLAGRYRLESLLGRGSMGAVWKARDVVLGRSVAVKEVLLPPTQTEEENHVARERALREARSIAALSHPNVVTLFDVVEDDGRPWVVMELVPAKSLAQIIKDDGVLAPTEAARIGVAVLAALNSAHEVGIIHRDVKPGNILVSPDGRVKLADFGISRRAEDSQLTRSGLMVGSPSYIAPEVARGKPAGPAADIWGLGATLQCAVEGEPPFDLGDPVATLTAVVGDPPRPAPHAGALGPVLGRMLDKDPRSRIHTDELRDALEQVASQRPGPRPTYAPPTGPLAPSSGTMTTQRPGSPPAQQLGYTQGPRPSFAGAHPVAPPSGHFPPTGQYAPATGLNSPASGLHAPGTGLHAPPSGVQPRPPATGYYTQPSPPAPKRSPWLPMLIGLLVAALVGGGVIWRLSSREDSGSNGSSSSSSSTEGTSSSSGAPSSSSGQSQPTENDTKIDGGTASGAIKVGDSFRPFSFSLPDGWEAGTFNEGRSEFILSSGGEDPATMVKVTVVAGELTANSVDAQIKAEQNQEGSPAKLPGYSNVDYKVNDQGNVLWQYTNKYKGADRRGYFYATDRDGVLWKVITAGPIDKGKETAELATSVIQSFQA